MERIQTHGDRESWLALGLIKLPLSALIQREEVNIENDSGGMEFAM